MPDRQQKRSFAEEGYVVVRRVVPAALLGEARREVGLLVEREPPPAAHVGPHFYFLADAPEALRAVLCGSPALTAAESLIAPGRFEPPEHVQVALNFPSCEGHRERWRDCVRDPFLEFDPVRAAAEEGEGLLLWPNS